MCVGVCHRLWLLLYLWESYVEFEDAAMLGCDDLWYSCICAVDATFCHVLNNTWAGMIPVALRVAMLMHVLELFTRNSCNMILISKTAEKISSNLKSCFWFFDFWFSVWKTIHHSVKFRALRGLAFPRSEAWHSSTEFLPTAVAMAIWRFCRHLPSRGWTCLLSTGSITSTFWIWLWDEELL